MICIVVGNSRQTRASSVDGTLWLARLTGFSFTSGCGAVAVAGGFAGRVCVCP